MAHTWTRQDKFKRGVWAVAFSAVIFVGAITGAQLKSDKQKEEAIKEFRATPTEEQVAILESQKTYLLQQKVALERKLDLFHEKLREQEIERQRELEKLQQRRLKQQQQQQQQQQHEATKAR